jgi:hypothetical protein
VCVREASCGYAPYVLCGVLVGWTRQRHFDETRLKTRRVLPFPLQARTVSRPGWPSRPVRTATIQKSPGRPGGYSHVKCLPPRSCIVQPYPNGPPTGYTAAQKKPSLNWVEVFHPSIKPMIDTKVPELSEKRMALIRIRRIGFFIAFSVRYRHAG